MNELYLDIYKDKRTKFRLRDIALISSENSSQSLISPCKVYTPSYGSLDFCKENLIISDSRISFRQPYFKFYYFSPFENRITLQTSSPNSFKSFMVIVPSAY